MAKTETIAIPVTFNFRESLAEELRAAADLLDPRPPSTTAEDLRGAEAEIARLNAVIDGMPYPSDFQNEDLVEKVARVLHRRSSPGHAAVCVKQDCWRGWVKDARAVLAAIGGDNA